MIFFVKFKFLNMKLARFLATTFAATILLFLSPVVQLTIQKRKKLRQLLPQAADNCNGPGTPGTCRYNAYGFKVAD